MNQHWGIKVMYLFSTITLCVKDERKEYLSRILLYILSIVLSYKLEK